MSTTDKTKTWIHISILIFTVAKVVLTSFGIYIPNIADLPTDQILNFLAAGGGAVSTAKLANSEPVGRL